jgi:hypothetical protein
MRRSGILSSFAKEGMVMLVKSGSFSNRLFVLGMCLGVASITVALGQVHHAQGKAGHYVFDLHSSIKGECPKRLIVDLDSDDAFTIVSEDGWLGWKGTFGEFTSLGKVDIAASRHDSEAFVIESYRSGLNRYSDEFKPIDTITFAIDPAYTAGKSFAMKSEVKDTYSVDVVAHGLTWKTDSGKYEVKDTYYQPIYKRDCQYAVASE